MDDSQDKKAVSRGQYKQTRYLSQAIQLEEAVNPHIIRATVMMVSLAVVIFLVWAAFTNINEIARTPGEIVPQGYQQTVQHFEGGMVREIHVHDGDMVEPGDVLLSLSGAGLNEDMERALSKQMSLEMQAERLWAFVEGREPDFSKFKQADEKMVADQMSFFAAMRSAREKEEAIIRGQIIQKQQKVQSLESDLQVERKNFAIVNDMHSRRLTLNKQGYASDMQLLEEQKRLNDIQGEINRLQSQVVTARSEITEFEGRLDSLSAGHRDSANEKLDSVLAEKSQNAQLIEKLEERMGRLLVRSPSHGLVKGMTVNTVGEVVKPGQTVMEIVPLDKELEVQVKIAPKDIGYLKVDQPVEVKVSTFDFSRYGSVRGRLIHISATTFTDDNGGRYYNGRVALDKNYVGNNPDNIVLPGMTVMADIITGRKTILQYLLKPIHRSINTAFSER